VIVIADSSPLIILAKLGCFGLLNKLYPQLCISTDVHREVVIAGAGMPGASEVATAAWIKVEALQNPENLTSAQHRFPLGLGELSTILLAQELSADVVLLDDYHARKLARRGGFQVRGSLGLLEIFHRRGYLADLREVFRQLLSENVYIDRRLIEHRLRTLGLPPL
jgi:predicted nucleic acid-binding protein